MPNKPYNTKAQLSPDKELELEAIELEAQQHQKMT